MICKFSIKDLEKLSGIKAHTLRIWEQRYGILKPQRTDTNIRWYCNEELKNILNVSLLNNNGYKISKIAELDKEEIAAEVAKIVNCQTVECEQVSSLIISMVEMDETRFEKIISSQILKKGFSHTIEEVIYPFLQKIGVMWQTGSINPAQEHFISNLIRQKLISAIDGLIPVGNKKAKKFILFLPDNELHEISLLYYNYVLKSQGHFITYLGQSVPLLDVQRVHEIKKVDYILSVLTHRIESPQAYINDLSKVFPKVKILLSGFQIVNTELKLPSNTSVFKVRQDLKKLIS
ncbi:MAG: MerR family transcriptional regulator [Bacteroidetes bacterium]|nr:MerR family transcriptional regulator [Bacteroidota bacterium]